MEVVLFALGLLLGACGLWIFGVVMIWLVSPLLMLDADTAFTNGLVIVVPKRFRASLTDDELQAVKAHEMGHIWHFHPITNLLRTCFLQRRSLRVSRQQELQADQYAASRGHAEALAAVLRRSLHPFDHHRARLLVPA